MKKEEWKTIAYNYPELSDYMVSSLGSILAKKREGTDGRIFKESIIKNRNRKAGTVLLTVQGKAKGFTVAQLVARTFLPNHSLEQDSVIHLDNDINNNRLSNLRWGTSAERYNVIRGIKGVVAKKDGKTRFFKTLSECSRKLGMPQSNISACLSDKSPRETAHGYSFERIYYRSSEDKK